MTTTKENLHRVNSTVQVMEVRLGDTVVGTITRLPNDTNVFSFDPGYAENTDRPTLSLSYKGPENTLLEKTRPTSVKLAPFFSNLLPEGHLREYLANKGGVNPQREFFLFWLLGADLPGAIRIQPLDGVLPPRDDAESHESNLSDSEQPLRFSLAGVQLKFSALVEANKGLTLPIAGVGGNWIVKLPSLRFKAVPENEYAMMSLAAAVGIDVPEIQLIASEDVKNLPDIPEAFGQAFAISRFDRAADDLRIHIEDFAQVFGVYPADKYKEASYGSLANVIWLETGETGITEFIRRLAFNVLIGNADAHLKNWSLIYRDTRAAQLAPAYDLVSTVPYIPNDGLALSIAGTKVFAEIDVERFRRLAEKAGLPVRLVVKTASETARAVRDLLPKHEPFRVLPEQIRNATESHLRSVPL